MRLGRVLASGLRGTMSSRFAVKYTKEATITAICFMSGSWMRSYNIHLGVVCARVVIQRILDESKARKAHGVEGEMIRAAGIANRQRGHPKIS